QSGSYLLQKPEIAIKIVESVVNSVSVPVTLKTRSGWDTDENGLNLIKEAADIGVAAVTLHPRKGKSQWSGDAKWEDIARIVSEINIPVIGNGDIKTPEDAQEMVNRTGCAGVMIGRGSIGNPWLFSQCSSFINDSVQLTEPTWEDRIDVCISHIEKLVEFRGEDIGVRESRKHVGRYLKGLPGASLARKKIVVIDKFSDVKQALLNYCAGLSTIEQENHDVS
ncbi:tRNA-dihydrouridine synthase, partial [bacterium]|nr:tRNA-dihydrouridine synthase [bacterium]MBU1025358.1 tRNA-dihydrouridine synthase [bacterium]